MCCSKSRCFAAILISSDWSFLLSAAGVGDSTPVVSFLMSSGVRHDCACVVTEPQKHTNTASKTNLITRKDAGQRLKAPPTAPVGFSGSPSEYAGRFQRDYRAVVVLGAPDAFFTYLSYHAR